MAEDSPDVNAMHKLATKRLALHRKFEEDGLSPDMVKQMVDEYLPLRRDASVAGSVRAAAQPDGAANVVADAKDELEKLLQRNSGGA
jgi:hypothetical protein